MTDVDVHRVAKCFEHHFGAPQGDHIDRWRALLTGLDVECALAAIRETAARGYDLPLRQWVTAEQIAHTAKRLGKAAYYRGFCRSLATEAEL